MPRGVRASSVSATNPAMWGAERLVSEPVSPVRPTLLWIDDFEPGLALYQTMFENLGFRVLTASSGRAGLKLAARHRTDIVVTDYEMPEMNGEEVAASIKAINPGTPVIMFSGSTLVPKRTRRVVDAFCDKAGSRDQILTTIHRLLHKKHTRTLQPAPMTQASDLGHRTVA